MPVNKANYNSIKSRLGDAVTLVAVSKTKPIEDILELYAMGHRDFGENYVQELETKQAQLPGDIRWHFIGHLQSNKVKFIVPFVHLIQGVDSLRLLKEIDKHAAKWQKKVQVLLQVHIAREETKFGMNEQELEETIKSAVALQFVKIRGLMGMASFSDDSSKVRAEFRYLKSLFDKYAECLMLNAERLAQGPELQTPNSELNLLSMGMSGDYTIAIEEGSNMVRIGSLLFGERSYH
jgi:pyridoxal phosphate enzyme (YggS family)